MTDENDVKPDLKTELEAKIAAEKAALSEQITAQDARAKETQTKLDNLMGQLQVLSAMAGDSAQATATVEAPDLVSDPERALDYHFQKRTGPLLAQQAAREAAREREMLLLKRAKDMEEFGDHVNTFIQKNGIKNEVLSQPGAYEKVLNLVQAEHIDEIVKKKVAAEVAAFQATAAKAATSGATGDLKDIRTEKKEETLSDEQKAIAKKLGVSEKAYLEAEKSTFTEGNWIRGAVTH